MRVTVRVLIVDDQESFRRAAGRAVARMPGFEVAGDAESGDASVELTRQLRPDLVLMDVHLPCIDGVEADAANPATSTRGSAPPVVILASTYDSADYALETATCGAAAYLPKAEFGFAAVRTL